MKRILSLLLMLCLLVGMAAPAVLAEEDTRIFMDDVGREVEIKKDIQRIVVSGPLAQIAVFAIAPEKFAGLATDWSKAATGLIGEEFLTLPVIGQLYGGKGQVNLEELAKLNPDVLIDLGEAKKSIVEDLDSLQEQIGVPCVHIAATLPTFGQAYRRLGELLDKPEEGEKLANYCENTYARTLSIMDKVEAKAKTVYVVNTEGLGVLAKTSFHAEVVDMLTDNVAVVEEVSSRGTGNPVDMEQLLLWNPDVLIFEYGGVFDNVEKDATWQALIAVQNKKYIEVPFGPYNWMGSPPSVQRYLALLWLPKVLYPDAADYDLYEEINQYFTLFYHKELPRETYDELMKNAFFP